MQFMRKPIYRINLIKPKYIIAIVIIHIILYIIIHIIKLGADMKPNKIMKGKFTTLSAILFISIANVACSVNPSATYGNNNANINISKYGVTANIGTNYNFQF